MQEQNAILNKFKNKIKKIYPNINVENIMNGGGKKGKKRSKTLNSRSLAAIAANALQELRDIGEARSQTFGFDVGEFSNYLNNRVGNMRRGPRAQMNRLVNMVRRLNRAPASDYYSDRDTLERIQQFVWNEFVQGAREKQNWKMTKNLKEQEMYSKNYARNIYARTRVGISVLMLFFGIFFAYQTFHIVEDRVSPLGNIIRGLLGSITIEEQNDNLTITMR